MAVEQLFDFVVVQPDGTTRVDRIPGAGPFDAYRRLLDLIYADDADETSKRA